MARVLATDPVTVTFRASEWHTLLSTIVASATSTEAFLNDLVNSGDERRDAWVFASADRLQHVVRSLDMVAELLHTAHARPVPRPGS